jgi:uncharacterized OB-fold protein
VLDPPAADGDTILFQRCTWCGTAMYHRLLCPVCQGGDLRTERSEGTGTVRHSTVVHRNTPAARNVSLIEMAEGFVVRGRVIGPPIGIHSGDRVRLSTAKDPVRGEPVFQLLDEPYRPGTDGPEPVAAADQLGTDRPRRAVPDGRSAHRVRARREDRLNPPPQATHRLRFSSSGTREAPVTTGRLSLGFEEENTLFRARRIWVTAAAVLAVAGGMSGSAQAAPPSDTGPFTATAAANDGTLPPGWRITGKGSAQQLVWRSARGCPWGTRASSSMPGANSSACRDRRRTAGRSGSASVPSTPSS